MLLGIVVPVICNTAISGKLTWSLYPLFSVIFAWLVAIPTVMRGRKGVALTLAALTVLIIPFMYAISKTAGNSVVFAIGVRVSVVTVAYLGCVYLNFVLLGSRKRTAAALALLLMIPLCVAINIIIEKVLAVSNFDVWDMLSYAVLAVSAAVLFILDCKKSRKNK